MTAHHTTKNLRRCVATALAVGLLPLLAACGGSSGTAAGADATSAADSGTNTNTISADGAVQLTVPDGADDDTKKLYIMENALAACMKKQGFAYTPHVGTAAASLDNIAGEDYALAKKARQKYGFGYYASAVYPNDPDSPFSNAGGKVAGKRTDPVDDDEKGFTPAQLKAYSLALSGPPAKSKGEEELGGCEAEAHEAAYGPALSAAAEKKAWEAKVETNRQNGLALNGDAQLVELAQEFATCLKAEGIPVTTTQPTGMADMVRLDIAGQIPENHGDMTKEEALPLLTKDIDVALKDLECGKEFRAAYFPKLKVHPYWGDSA